MIKHYCIGLTLVFSTAFVALTLPSPPGEEGRVRGKIDPPLKRFAFSEPHMGTTFEIVLYTSDEETAKQAARAAFARIAELDGIMSDYRPTSELMKLCEQAGGPPVKVSDDLFAVLEQAQKTAQLSAGAFDVTVGPIVRLWRKARRTREVPSAEALKKALALVGHEKMQLDPLARTVQLMLVGMLLDLGGIAKGYAADAALAVLRRRGISQALVAAGGDITVGDPPPKTSGWKVGIAPLKNPEGKPSHYLLLKNAAVSTAGDASQFVEINGVRYSHIVDPKTGLGLLGRRSVTVIAGSGMRADALDTTVCVLGPERGLALIEAAKDSAALYVFEVDGELNTRATKRFAEYGYR